MKKDCQAISLSYSFIFSNSKLFDFVKVNDNEVIESLEQHYICSDFNDILIGLQSIGINFPITYQVSSKSIP